MKPLKTLLILIGASVALLLSAASAPAAPLGVRDEAHFFSADAIRQADQTIQQINQRHQEDLLIETLPSVPQDKQDQLQQLGKAKFFEQWANDRARQQGVNGVYVLITRDPTHLQAAVGNHTRQRVFTLQDRDELSKQLIAAFKIKQYDQGLISAVDFVSSRMDANGGSAPARTGSAAPPVGAYPQTNTPPTNAPTLPRGTTGFHLGGIACVIIGVILFIVLIRGIFGRSGGGRPGGYYPPGAGGYPQGGGYPPPQGGYGGGYGGGGGGGGFGRGFLGGLLGGAVGGYAADRWMHPGQQGGGAIPPAGGGATSDPGSQTDTSFSSTGGDFGSSDQGGGGGADFGGGGGGGGDFGGGGGGDF